MEKISNIIKLPQNSMRMPCKTPLCPSCARKGIQTETTFFIPEGKHFDGFKPIPMLCNDCESEQIQVWELNQERLAKEAVIKHKEKILTFSNTGTKYRNSSFENFDSSREGLNCADIWAKRFTNRILNGGDKISLYMFGETGVGKTELQYCSYNKLTKEGKNCLFTTLGKLFEEMHDYKRVSVIDVYKIIKELDALFIDDFGSETLDKQSKGWLFEILDIVDKFEIPLFASSNFRHPKHWIKTDNDDNIENIKIQRVFSRLKGKMTTVENKASDYRLIQAEIIKAKMETEQVTER